MLLADAALGADAKARLRARLLAEFSALYSGAPPRLQLPTAVPPARTREEEPATGDGAAS